MNCLSLCKGGSPQNSNRRDSVERNQRVDGANYPNRSNASVAASAVTEQPTVARIGSSEITITGHALVWDVPTLAQFTSPVSVRSMSSSSESEDSDVEMYVIDPSESYVPVSNQIRPSWAPIPWSDSNNVVRSEWASPVTSPETMMSPGTTSEEEASEMYSHVVYVNKQKMSKDKLHNRLSRLAGKDPDKDKNDSMFHFDIPSNEELSFGGGVQSPRLTPHSVPSTPLKDRAFEFVTTEI